VDGDRDALRGSLYLDKRDAAMVKPFPEIVPDKEIFVNIVGNLIFGEPVRNPGSCDAKP
jgi:hypothetical protein